jgi:hypothetical protein
MNPYQDLDDRATNAESLQDSAQVLADLLGGGYAVWTDSSLYSIKQLVARVDGLKIHIYPDEHAPPHFHVLSANIDASFTIEDCTLLKGSIGGRERSLVEWWFARSRPRLVAVWNETRSSDCQVGPIK